MLSALGSSLQAGEMTEAARLEEIREEWKELWARCPGATPFQTPEWLIPWWRRLGEGEFRAFVLRRDGRLAGFLPCFLYSMPGSGERQLMLLGSGNSDHLEGLLEPGAEKQGAALFFGWLREIRDRWDLCDLQQLPPSSPLLAHSLAGWREERAVQDVCPVLELPEREEEHSSRISPRLLQNFRYSWRRAGRSGDFRVERAEEETVEELIGELFRLHGARWRSRGEEGVLADQRIQLFHREAARELLRAGLLHLDALRLDEKVMAVYYGFLHRGRAYYYLSGFDPAFEHLSPGTLVVGHAVREAIRQGAREFDFLRGREEYKYRWGAKDRPNWTRRLRHSGEDP